MTTTKSDMDQTFDIPDFLSTHMRIVDSFKPNLDANTVLQSLIYTLGWLIVGAADDTAEIDAMTEESLDQLREAVAYHKCKTAITL
jgi:hypothetical protein